VRPSAATVVTRTTNWLNCLSHTLVNKGRSVTMPYLARFWRFERMLPDREFHHPLAESAPEKKTYTRDDAFAGDRVEAEKRASRPGRQISGVERG
jgi:hypothetical protein